MGAVVVGTGFGCLTHARVLRSAGFDVKALVGRDVERTSRRAEMMGIAVGTSSLTAALELDGVHAVSIATPPHTHAALAREAIAAGKHVLCEKPFTADAAEARELAEAAESAGLVGLLGHEHRYFPGYALLARTLHDGAIGTPRVATVIWNAPALADPSTDAPGWWIDPAQGGGWLGAHAPHMIDYLRVCLGEFASVSGKLTLVSDHDWAVDDTYEVAFEMANGTIGVMQSSWGAWGPPNSVVRISGTRGTLWIEGDFSWSKVKLADANGEREVPMPDDLVLGDPEPSPPELVEDLDTHYGRLHGRGVDLPAYRRLGEAFRDLVLGVPLSGPAPATFRDGLAHMQVLDAVRRSAAERTWVDIEA
jgi:predicted dehydrogenase